MFQEGLDPEDATVPEAQSDPNGTEKVLLVGVPLGSTSMDTIVCGRNLIFPMCAGVEIGGGKLGTAGAGAIVDA